MRGSTPTILSWSSWFEIVPGGRLFMVNAAATRDAWIAAQDSLRESMITTKALARQSRNQRGNRHLTTKSACCHFERREKSFPDPSHSLG